MPEIKGKEAVRLLSGEAYSGEANVCCPRCKGEFTHVLRVGTLLGSDSHEAGVIEGTVVTGKTGARRSSLEVVFWCETCRDGRHDMFSLVIGQQKGVSLVEFRTIAAFSSPDRAAAAKGVDGDSRDDDLPADIDLDADDDDMSGI